MLDLNKLKHLVCALKSRPFYNLYKGIFTLVIGSSVARLLAIMTIPILTRIYSPEDFGVLAVYVSVVTVLTPILTMRYVLAIPLPRLNSAAINIVSLSIILIFVVGAIVYIFLSIFWLSFTSALLGKEMEPFLELIIIGALVSATNEVFTLWATRYRGYKEIAKSNVAQSLGGSLAKILFGLIWLKPIGLQLGEIFEKFVGLLVLLMQYKKSLIGTVRHIKITRIRYLAVRYCDYPMYRLPSQILMAFSMKAPLIFSAALFDIGTTGQLGLAFMAIALPISIIGGAVGNAVYAEAAAIGKRNPNRILGIAKEAQNKLLFMSLFPALILFFYGELLFSFMFGDAWRGAGKFASILSVSLVFQFTSTPLVQLLNIFEAQRVYLMINVLRVLGLLVIYYVFSRYHYSAEMFVWVCSIFMAALYIFISWFTINYIKNKVTG